MQKPAVIFPHLKIEDKRERQKDKKPSKPSCTRPAQTVCTLLVHTEEDLSTKEPEISLRSRPSAKWSKQYGFKWETGLMLLYVSWLCEFAFISTSPQVSKWFLFDQETLVPVGCWLLLLGVHQEVMWPYLFGCATQLVFSVGLANLQHYSSFHILFLSLWTQRARQLDLAAHFWSLSFNSQAPRRQREASSTLPFAAVV